MSWKRPHIVRSTAPLQEHRQVQSACLKEIYDPVFVLTVEGDISGKMELSDECFCRKCIMACQDRPQDCRYLYGAVEASQVKQEESDV